MTININAPQDGKERRADCWASLHPWTVPRSKTMSACLPPRFSTCHSANVVQHRHLTTVKCLLSDEQMAQPAQPKSTYGDLIPMNPFFNIRKKNLTSKAIHQHFYVALSHHNYLITLKILSVINSLLNENHAYFNECLKVSLHKSGYKNLVFVAS